MGGGGPGGVGADAAGLGLGGGGGVGGQLRGGCGVGAVSGDGAGGAEGGGAGGRGGGVGADGARVWGKHGVWDDGGAVVAAVSCSRPRWSGQGDLFCCKYAGAVGFSLLSLI